MSDLPGWLTDGETETWLLSGSVLVLVLTAALVSVVRAALAKGSRPAAEATRNGDGVVLRPKEAPPIRTRVLGALVLAAIGLNVAATVVASFLLIPRFGAAGATGAFLLMSALISAAEALALLGSVQRAVSGALRLLGIRIDRYARTLSASEEIRGQVDLLHQQGGVIKEERDMLGGLLDLKELHVSDAMVHRTKMRMLDADLPPDEMIREVLASPYTRLPLWRDDPETIVGVLHAKDLLRAARARTGPFAPIDVDRLAAPPWFIPATTSLRDQLKAFLARKQHFALVVDEYGGLMGLVTLEDILEEIVGEISDEHDVAPRGVRPQPDGSILADGSVPIRDLNRLMDWHLPDEEATTVAGLVIHEAMLIPEAGQVFTFHGFRFEVLRRSRNRVVALRIAPAERARPDHAQDPRGEPGRAAAE